MNEDTWIELLHEQMPPLYRSVSRRVGGDRALAEDLTQETWLRALEAWRRQGPPRDPAAWLTTVASNLLRNHFRHAGAELDSDLDRRPASGESERQAVAELAERAAALQRGLARLKPDAAALLSERHFDGHSLEVLACARGLSTRAVEGRLRRARAALARHVDPGLLDGQP
ncbi:MAG: sigma-70 family RNA polymerase sigma factor [Planctomycetota bacterium]